MNFSENDIQMMKRALELGAHGKGSTFPNPPVGAVIVRDGRIVGEGWHRKRGESHAEVIAIENARSRGEILDGATMFVTLEPCCHHGLTPPCTDAILESKIARVVVSCRDDFDERVCGKGLSILHERGVEVAEGVLREEGERLIEQYRVQRTEKRAFLTAKWAQSIDGRIATAIGDSQWISGKPALRFAHELRERHGAVAVGANTAIIDDPRMTIREIESHHSPARIVLAGKTILPATLSVLSSGPRTIIVHGGENPQIIDFENGIEALEIPVNKDFWRTLLSKLYEIGIGSVLLEGGGKVITSALDSGAVDKAYIVVAPIFIGNGIQAVGDLGVKKLSEAIPLQKTRFSKFGDDIIISGYPIKTK